MGPRDDSELLLQRLLSSKDDTSEVCDEAQAREAVSSVRGPRDRKTVLDDKPPVSASSRDVERPRGRKNCCATSASFR